MLKSRLRHVSELHFKAQLFLLLHLLTAVAFWTGCAGDLVAQDAPAKIIKVITKREGEVTRFYVDNFQATEVTATFELQMANLKGSRDLPFTGTFPANKITEAFNVSPINAAETWNFSYTTHYAIGSTTAIHDDAYVYSLPFRSGDAYRVTQGYNGCYSHTGPDQFAIDFKMSSGTPIHAARDGMVVKVKEDSNVGGADRKYENSANYILIRHIDGTIANYAHLSKNGSKVKVGQVVQAGDFIALSGSTGFSSGPHLHFSIFKTKDGAQRISIPVQFETASDLAITLVEGRSYKCLAHEKLPTKSSVTLVAPAAGKNIHASPAVTPQEPTPNREAKSWGSNRPS